MGRVAYSSWKSCHYPPNWPVARRKAGTHVQSMHKNTSDNREPEVRGPATVPPSLPARQTGQLAGGHDVRVCSVRRPTLPHGRIAIVVWAYVALAIVSLIATSLLYPVSPGISTPFVVGGLPQTTTGVAFWILIEMAGCSWSRGEEGRASLVFGGAAVIAAIVLGGPTAGGWVALLGTLELRELRGDIPWYGVLANHAMHVVPAVLGGLACIAVGGSLPDGSPAALPTAAAAATFWVANTGMALALLWARTGRRPAEALGIPWASLGNWMLATSAIGWLVSLSYRMVWWSPLALVAVNASSAASLSASQSDWLLRHHHLTDLPNGRSLNERVADLRRAGRTGLCVFYIDLDGFKSVNDTYGHSVGDDVLKEVGLRFHAAKRSEDFLAHLHGDEFVLLAQGIGSDSEAVTVLNRLKDSLSRPIEHVAGPIRIGVSVGFRRVNDLDDLDAALREADRNMAAAKTAHAVASGRERR
jgi:diguanylate cyclase (GGDEF)-like protein